MCIQLQRMAMGRPYKDADWLREKYHDEEMTTREIAEVCDSSSTTISRWLDKHDIEARPNWKAGQEKATEVNRVNYVKRYILPTGYEYWTLKDCGKTVNVYVHRLTAVAKYGLDAVADKDVHHKNGIPWDNRVENIEIMDKREHASLHARQRHYGENPYEGHE